MLYQRSADALAICATFCIYICLLCSVTVSCSGSNPIQFCILFSLPCVPFFLLQSRQHRGKMHLSAESTSFSYMIQAPGFGVHSGF
ncbi:hypothetical protein EDC04DRAFT_2763574 [Pisolithus marmoratus]|nr:hypothetical protein EDC04DRAFT_2763574 [Pisolithus marmoratus]